MTAHLTILHRDAHAIWVDKPAGLLSVPGIGPEKQDCVVSRMASESDWVREAHRLDQATSGIMLVARHPDAHRAFCRQFQDRIVGKTYEAVVAGVVSDATGRIDIPIRADIDNRPMQIVDHEHGKAASTRYEVVDADPALNRTRLRLFPETGRTHQLRIHLASIGHPILGDDLYAPPDILALSPRLLLHATRLCTRDIDDFETEIIVESSCPF